MQSEAINFTSFTHQFFCSFDCLSSTASRQHNDRISRDRVSLVTPAGACCVGASVLSDLWSAGGGQSKFDKNTSVCRIICIDQTDIYISLISSIVNALEIVSYFLSLDYQDCAGGPWCICVGNDCIITSLSRSQSQDVPKPLSPPRTMADAHHDTLIPHTTSWLGGSLLCWLQWSPPTMR